MSRLWKGKSAAPPDAAGSHDSGRAGFTATHVATSNGSSGPSTASALQSRPDDQYVVHVSEPGQPLHTIGDDNDDGEVDLNGSES